MIQGFDFDFRETIEDLGWQYLYKAEEETEIAFSNIFDSVIETELPENVPAATRHLEIGNYSKTELLLDDDFKELTSSQKLNVSIHEGVHGLAENKRLGQELREVKNIDPELDRVISRIMSGDKTSVEGMVQSLANSLDPNDNSGRYFRPQETRFVNQILSDEGIDLDLELNENQKSGLYDREIEKIDLGTDFYHEKGEFNGENYSVSLYGLNPFEQQDFGYSYLEECFEDYEEEGNKQAESYAMPL